MNSTLAFPPPQFLLGGRYFDETGFATVGAGVNRAALVTITVPSGRSAILMGIGADSAQLTNAFWARFELEIAGAVDATFNNIRGMSSRLLEPMPLYRIAPPASLLVVRVSNLNASVAFTYAARLQGWFVSSDSKLGQMTGDVRAG